MSDKILILGGNGTIGEAVTRQLVNRGEDVTLLLRPDRKPMHPVKVVTGDGNDEPALAALQQREKFDIVINLLIYTPEQAEMNLRVFRDVKQLIFISTVCVHDREQAVVFNEESVCGNRFSSYGQNKRLAEQVFLRAAEQDGFPVTIVRPTQTYGGKKLPLSVKGGSYWGICQRILDGKPVIVHGDGSSTWVSTYCDDLAAGIMLLVGNDAAVGQIWQITSDEVLSWDQMYRILGEELGREPKIVHIPTDILVKIGMDSGLRGDKEASVIFDNAKIKKLGFAPQVSFREGVRKYLAGVEKHPEWKTVDPAFDERCDAVCAAWERMAENFNSTI